MDPCQPLSSPRALVTCQHQLSAGKHVNKKSSHEHIRKESKLFGLLSGTDCWNIPAPKGRTDHNNRRACLMFRYPEPAFSLCWDNFQENQPLVPPCFHEGLVNSGVCPITHIRTKKCLNVNCDHKSRAGAHSVC